jgi:hypothetical protein
MAEISGDRHQSTVRTRDETRKTQGKDEEKALLFARPPSVLAIGGAQIKVC